MQSILPRHAALRASPARLSGQISHARTPIARRTYAQQAPDPNTRASKEEGVSEGGGNNRLPLIFAGCLAVFIPTFYMINGTGSKAVGSGQATIKEERREKGTENEYRDPRDSGKKTTESDRIRQEAAKNK